jgi:hypothetical protein
VSVPGAFPDINTYILMRKPLISKVSERRGYRDMKNLRVKCRFETQQAAARDLTGDFHTITGSGNSGGPGEAMGGINQGF